uniref:Uncharacterized protein n=1 Tax=Anopheles farauti TaxID=69004 RepID=A0A182QZT7_9DIPT
MQMAHQMLQRFVVHRRHAMQQLPQLEQPPLAAQFVRRDKPTVQLVRQQRLREVAYERLQQRRDDVHVVPARIAQRHLVQPAIDSLGELRNGGRVARDAIDADHTEALRFDHARALGEYERHVRVLLRDGTVLERHVDRGTVRELIAAVGASATVHLHARLGRDTLRFGLLPSTSGPG